MSDEPEMVIPFDRLPPGFAERVDAPDEAAPVSAAATAVLVRDATDAPELLLLKRHRSSGFVPGAYVFPGGRVDSGDSAQALVELLGDVARGPHASYWLGAVREVFEETGVLLARRRNGMPLDATHAQLASWRDALLDHRAVLLDVMNALDARPDISRTVYCSHWITPAAEPRRYDTRFFISELPPGTEATIDEREMSDVAWLTADVALQRYREGSLPMVFPTIKTIQMLAHYRSVDEMLGAFRDADVPATLPRLVRTEDGVGIVLDE
ncbi:NUDIX hydrolase [soil metagenome]